MSLAVNPPDYKTFARIQNETKDADTIELIRLALEKLMLQYLPEGAHILDLGCGTAQLVQQLQKRGYQMTGIDASEELLCYARQNATESKFIHSDIREFELPAIFNGVFSRDVLLFILNIEELLIVFGKVYAALQENGLFVFTMPLADWEHGVAPQSYEIGDATEEYVWIQKRKYNQEERIWQFKLTVFELLEGNWQRSDTTWLRKDYFLEEIKSALENVGFSEISYFNTKEFGDTSLIGDACFVCRKKSVD